MIENSSIWNCSAKRFPGIPEISGRLSGWLVTAAPEINAKLIEQVGLGRVGKKKAMLE